MEPFVEMPKMSEYGVSQADWDGLPWSWASERLAQSRSYWVTTVTESGSPHSMPVWGVWNTVSNTFAFSCAARAKKLRNLLFNPQVSFSADDTVEVVSVQGTGRVVGSDDEEFNHIVSAYASKYGHETPGDLEEFVRSNAVVSVRPRLAFGVIEREAEFAIRATRWNFSR